MPSVDDTRERLAELGIRFADEEWEALPAPARRRLANYPTRSAVDRKSLAALARWLVSTFPPGWGAPPAGQSS